MPKLSERELGKLLLEYSTPQSRSRYTHRFPQKWERKDFPLLFPKSPEDEDAIRQMASRWYIDYDGLKEQLKKAEVPQQDRKDYRRIFRDFKEGYKALWLSVQNMGEEYGIDLSRYAISKRRTRT